ncbi:hypothetical protein BKA70DRAFT_357890 [Coprinopsis sp. MPI-PUGE-AT-0042]|nr:hypothetical protein BKA70DRAFT_357890 [Coprinopsis sp. MPI-PUGE-AT-0042]
MPNNIELAISAALLTGDSQTTPNIVHILSAYVQVAEFSDLHPSFTISKSNPACSKCSDAVVISAFERAIEKAASSNSPGASEASRLVPKVRRQYWRGILIAAGNKDDELTQLLIKAERKEMGDAMPLLSLEPLGPAAATPDAPISDAVISLKKSKKKKRRSSKEPSTEPQSNSSPGSGTTTIAFPNSHVAITPPGPLTLGCAGYNPTLTRAALVSPRLKALSIPQCHTANAGEGPAPLKTSQRYVPGEGYKTYYPCPCCGGGSVRAKQMMRSFGIDEDGDGSDEVVHEGEEEQEEHAVTTKKKISRKRKTSTKGEEGGRKKTRQVKRRSKVGTDSSKLPAFDPFAPSSSRVSM